MARPMTLLPNMGMMSNWSVIDSSEFATNENVSWSSSRGSVTVCGIPRSGLAEMLILIDDEWCAPLKKKIN